MILETNIHKENGIELLVGGKSLRNILITLLPIILTSCGLIPWPISVLHTATDILTVTNTGKTTAELAVSEITEKDCRFPRILYDAPTCMNEEEYLNYILSKNCKVYTWNWLNLPSCKE